MTWSKLIIKRKKSLSIFPEGHKILTRLKKESQSYDDLVYKLGYQFEKGS